ncbi:MAG: alanine racemase [bacterium]|nr:alanine racemase [bacterium]
MQKPEDLRTWIEIDKKAIAHNYRVFRKLIGKRTKFLAVVKSNAYGHNLLEFAPEMEKLGADWLGVDSLVEARSARSAGVKIPILVLGFTLPTFYEEAREKKMSITISSFAQLTKALRLKKGKHPLKIHIKVDTGMHRQGFQLHEAGRLLQRLKGDRGNGHRGESSVLRGLSSVPFSVEGLYTHLAEAKNPRDGDSTRRQIAEFHEWIKKFDVEGITPICHAAATGGAMLYPEAHFDMVRIGIGCYGLWPSSEAEHFLAKAASGGSPVPHYGIRGRKVTLKPVLSWKAIVSEVKEVKKGERVGYDFTERLTRDSILAVIPVGYWHGIPRLCSSKGRVLIRGKTARIVGRVSMDMIVVDVTDIPKVTMGDEAVLIGRSGKEEIKAGEIAAFAGTTHYEIVTRLNPLIKKFYL